jgi:small conductance mechanosensitive channel
VPLREPESVDVKVRLGAGMRPTHVQAILDEKLTTPTRDSPRVLLEEVDGDALVVRIQATPENPLAGAALADEVVEALMAVEPAALQPTSTAAG